MVVPLLRFIWSRISNAREPDAQRTTYPSPTTSQQVAPRSSVPTRMNAACSSSTAPSTFWLTFELRVEAEFVRESHRTILREMNPAQLLEAADAIVRDYHLKLHLLNQYVRRVAELECRAALIDDVDERHLQAAREILRDLGTE